MEDIFLRNICLLSTECTALYTRKCNFFPLRFEVLVVVMKNSVFWDITTCSPIKGNRCFGGTCYLSLQGRRINRTRNQREITCLHRDFFFGLFFDPEDGDDILPKRQLSFNGLYDVMS
jgi:hypothetical protein